MPKLDRDINGKTFAFFLSTSTNSIRFILYGIIQPRDIDLNTDRDIKKDTTNNFEIIIVLSRILYGIKIEKILYHIVFLFYSSII